VKAEEPTYIVVETMEGEVLGGFAASPWHIDKNVSHSFFFITLGRYTIYTIGTNAQHLI
jgi:hypothetical protein